MYQCQHSMLPPRDALVKYQKNKYRDQPRVEGVLSGALALLVRVSTCAGVCPLRFKRVDNGWLPSISAPLATLQRTVITVFNLVMVAALIMDFCQEPEMRIRIGETTLKAFVWISDMVLMMMIASVAVYLGPSRMENFIYVLNQLHQVSLDLKINPPSEKSEKIKNIAVICFMIWAVSILTADFHNYMLLSVQENRMWSIMCMYSTYYVANVQGVLVVLQWCGAVLAVQAVTVTLNDHLNQLRHANLEIDPNVTLDLFGPSKSGRVTLVDCFTKQRKLNPGAKPSTSLLQAQATIRRLALSHERISEVMRQMNATNGTFLMTILMSTFLRLVLTPYYLLLKFDYAERVLSEAVLQINWSLFHVGVLLMTIEPCHWMQQQRERTQILLSQLIVHVAPKSEGLSKELDQFAKQILLSNAKFMPLGR